jgi:hypothetical protein
MRQGEPCAKELNLNLQYVRLINHLEAIAPHFLFRGPPM